MKLLSDRCMVAMRGGSRVAPKIVVVCEPVRWFRLGAAFECAQLFDDTVQRYLAVVAPTGKGAFAFAASRKLMGWNSLKCKSHGRREGFAEGDGLAIGDR